MKHPNFFIVGAPKCGTTALAQYLSEHQSVFMTDPKEPHHFSTDLNHGKYRDRDQYLELFSTAGHRHVAVGEASVWYLYSDEAVPNILRAYPDAKFIVLLRNPVEMAPSLHEQLVFSGYEAERNFRKAWDLQKRRQQGKDIPVRCPEPALLQYAAACRVGAQYERLLKHVDENRLLTILLDDFAKEPRSVWLGVLNFLGVADDGRVEFPVVNPAKERRSLLAQHSIDLMAQFRGLLGLSGFGTGILERLKRSNVKQRARSPLPDDMRARLVAVFGDDIDLLASRLDRDLGHWVESA